MTCAILGDSLAVGLAHAMPQCWAHARTGISSADFAAAFPLPVAADTAVISLTANDFAASLAALGHVRARVTARRVIWLMPNIRRPAQRDAVLTVAAEHGDEILDTAPFTSGGLHPSAAGYRGIAAEITRTQEATR